MPKYKNIRVKMKNGKTRTQRVQVLANGQYKFVKNSKGKTRSRTSKKKGSKRKTSKRSYKPRSKTTRRRGNSGMKGIATLVGVAGSVMSGYGVYKDRRDSHNESMGESFLYVTTGYDVGGDNAPDKMAFRLIRTYGPTIAGVAISKCAGKFGVNQKLPKGINL